MECKFVLRVYTPHLPLSELIDTLWNVNCFSAFLFCFGAAELIDTLWNVNVTDATAINKMETELIDTLWNVNTN